MLEQAVLRMDMAGRYSAYILKQKTHHMGTFFLLTGCGGWISLARHKVPAARKFVVIRTAFHLFLYTNFEPQLRCCFKSINRKTF